MQTEAKGRAEDDAKEGKPSHSEADIVRELEERLLHAGHPDRLDGARHDGDGDKPEGDDTRQGIKLAKAFIHIRTSGISRVGAR